MNIRAREMTPKNVKRAIGSDRAFEKRGGSEGGGYALHTASNNSVVSRPLRLSIAAVGRLARLLTHVGRW